MIGMPIPTDDVDEGKDIKEERAKIYVTISSRIDKMQCQFGTDLDRNLRIETVISFLIDYCAVLKTEIKMLNERMENQEVKTTLLF
jgi:hypothetical protein